jgi:hypothetical protein
MFKKRPLVAPTALGGFICLGAVAAVWLPEEPGVTHAHFKRVAVGMTRAETEEIFGVPPSDTAPNGRDWSGVRVS